MSARAVGRKYGFTPPVICKHINEHMGAALVEHNLCAPVLDAIRRLHARTLRVLAAAEGKGDLNGALAAIREARGNLTLLAKLTGELRHSDAPDRSEPVNVVVTYVDKLAVLPRGDDEPPALPPVA
jgi:hypothetical protein